MLVAASDALTSTKAKADFVCVGVDDQEQIEAALNISHAMGADLALSEGNFATSAPIQLDTNKVVALCGVGPLTTVINADLPEGESAFLISGGHHHSISNLGIAGTYHAGILLDGVGYCVLDSLRMEEPTLAGVRLMGDNCTNRLHNIEVVDSLGYGIWELGVANYFEAIHVRQPIIGGLAGFRISGLNSVYASIAVDNKPQGVWVTQYARATAIDGIYVEGCTVGLRVESGAEPIPTAISVNGLYCHGCETPIDVQAGSGISINNIVVR